MTVKLRYKKRRRERRACTVAVTVADRGGELTANLGFAAAVAEYGMLLRRLRSTKATRPGRRRRGSRARYRGEDPGGYRAEFIRLLNLAAALNRPEAPQQTRR